MPEQTGEKGAVCARCGSVVPMALTACPTCGALRTTPEADTRKRFTGDGEGADEPQDETDEARFQSGQKMLGHYVVVRQLGRGGMGTVYLARDEVSGQEVAVKVLPASLARERDIRERFVQEARALATMDHPNIVPLVTFAEESEDRFLVMKYIPGEPLDQRIRRLAVLAPEDAAKILRALLSALGYAHARGVIHRDVKPSNVIIEGDLSGAHRIFLVDFGIAKKEESKDKLTQTGMLMGTPQYMSPEQISGQVVDGRSDLYAAGLVLFEMLCGRPPFDGEKTFQVLRAHVEQPVPNLVETRGSPLPEALIQLTHMLLEKEPIDRPANASEAIELLDGTGSFPIRPLPAAPAAPTLPLAPARQQTKETVELDADGELQDPSMDEIRAIRPRRASYVFALLFLGAIGAGAWLTLRQDLLAAFDPPQTGARDGGRIGEGPIEDGVVDDHMKITLLLAKGKVKLSEKDFENALVLANAALSIDAEHAPTRLFMADVLLTAGKLDEADKELAALGATTNLDDNHRLTLDTLNGRLVEARERKASQEAERDRERRERDRRERERGQPPSKISKAALADATSAASAAMRRCYEDEVLKKRPRAKGEVQIIATVKPDGRVDGAQVKAPKALQVANFSGCVKDAAKKWKFPAWQGKAEDYRHKIMFSPR